MDEGFPWYSFRKNNQGDVRSLVLALRNLSANPLPPKHLSCFVLSYYPRSIPKYDSNGLVEDQMTTFLSTVVFGVSGALFLILQFSNTFEKKPLGSYSGKLLFGCFFVRRLMWEILIFKIASWKPARVCDERGRHSDLCQRGSEKKGFRKIDNIKANKNRRPILEVVCFLIDKELIKN